MDKVNYIGIADGIEYALISNVNFPRPCKYFTY